MKKTHKYIVGLMTLVLICMAPIASLGKEKEPLKKQYTIPDHVLNISKENTFPNATEDQEVVEPSKLTKSLIKGSETPIDNPKLIKMLNETSIKPSPIGIGYRGMVYLGRWPLNYESEATTINWEYQPVNQNELDNIGGDTDQTLQYNQTEQKKITGALTNKISNSDDVKKMMLLNAQEETDLPLAYQAVIGQDTKKDNVYNVPVKKQGELQAYAPAVNEKGHVTFGEVYIQLKGTKKSLVVKNVTKQGIGAWIPIHDHLSFSFHLK